jgi:hypothetical protein
VYGTVRNVKNSLTLNIHAKEKKTDLIMQQKKNMQVLQEKCKKSQIKAKVYITLWRLLIIDVDKFSAMFRI